MADLKPAGSATLAPGRDEHEALVHYPEQPAEIAMTIPATVTAA